MSRLALSNRLMELFVVSVIVITITVAAFVLLSGILAESRDTKRLNDITAIRKALEYYRLEHGHYPQTGRINSTEANWMELGSALSPYLSGIPTDPINESGAVEETGAFNYSYYSSNEVSAPGGRHDYLLIFRLERPDRAAIPREAISGVLDTAETEIVVAAQTDGIYVLSAP